MSFWARSGKKYLEPPQKMTVPKPCSGDHNLYFPFRPRKENLEIEEVKPHPSLSHLYAANKMLELQFSPVEVPMLCPPLPWLSTRTGAYILRSTGLVRVRAPTSFYPHHKGVRIWEEEASPSLPPSLPRWKEDGGEGRRKRIIPMRRTFKSKFKLVLQVQKKISLRDPNENY